MKVQVLGAPDLHPGIRDQLVLKEKSCEYQSQCIFRFQVLELSQTQVYVLTLVSCRRDVAHEAL